MYFLDRQLARVFSTALLAVCLAACSQSKPNASVAAPKPDKNSGGKKDGVDSQQDTRDGNTAGNESGAFEGPPPSITIADKAAEHLAFLAQDSGLKLERVAIIGVKEGGEIVFTNGGDTRYKYTLMQTDDPVDWNELFRVESNGVTIGVNKKFARFLDGLAISLVYIDGGKKLRFDNPNVARVMTPADPSDSDGSSPSTSTPELDPIPHVNDSEPHDPDTNRGGNPPSVLDK